jgi:hypothetical protein
VPALPGGYLEVKERSGMRGRFAYAHGDRPAKKHSGKGQKDGKRRGAATVGSGQA